MIIVRPYRLSDAEQIKQIHHDQALPYDTPAWEKMLVSCVIEKDGKIEMAGFLRKTAESYLLVDPNNNLRRRELLGRLLVLQREMIPVAKKNGLEDCHAWLPPQLADFGKVLTNPVMGWQPAPWPCFFREL
jgi:hypothetical protein